MKRLRSIALGGLFLTFLAQCGDNPSSLQSGVCGNGVPGSPNASFWTGVGLFTSSPVPLSSTSRIVALGGLNPPAHTYPSDRVTFVLADATAGNTHVYAATAGTVSRVQDGRVLVQVDRSFFYYYDGVIPMVGVGTELKASQLVGTNRGANVDFGVWNFNQARAGILDPCLANYESHADAPLRFYTDWLQTALYAKVDRAGDDKDGTIGYDVDGELVGDWVASGKSALGDPGSQLAFVYDAADPTQQRIAVGADLGGPAVYAIASGAPDFRAVTPGSGPAEYTLSPSARLVVRMQSPALLAVELIAGDKDSGVLTYVR